MIVSISRQQSFLNGTIWTWCEPRIERSLIVAICMLLFIAMLFEAVPSTAAETDRQTVFERADFVLSEGRRAPDDNSAWQPVSLPHEWRHTHPGSTGQGWYRLTFELAQVPRTVQAILLLHERSQECDFYINGKIIGGARDQTARAGTGAGVVAFGHRAYGVADDLGAVNIRKTEVHEQHVGRRCRQTGDRLPPRGYRLYQVGAQVARDGGGEVCPRGAIVLDDHHPHDCTRLFVHNFHARAIKILTEPLAVTDRRKSNTRTSHRWL